MKLVKKVLEKDGSGAITLRPEEAEDLWHVYNLVSKGDQLLGTTFRRVTKETATGYSSSERVRIRLKIEVDSVDFDPGAELIRFGGRNVSESEFVRLGAFHTLELELKREVTIIKPYWDSVALDIVETACNPAASADLAAVVMSEGLANICLITSTMTLVRSRIEASIPKKRRGSAAGHEKGLEKFFESVLRGIQQHINFDVVKAILIASPGFVKDQFYKYLFDEAVRQDLKVILQNKSKFILCHASSGHKHALKEVLSDPAIASKLSDTKAAGDVQALQEFYDMMKNDPDRAFYSGKHVLLANERGAIQTLLLADSLFRSAGIEARKKYVALVESVKENGGEVRIFSTQHVSGEQLKNLGGIAAILRFPLPDIVMEDDEEEIEEEEEDGSDSHSAELAHHQNGAHSDEEDLDRITDLADSLEL